MSFLSALTLVFITLRLCSVIDWSWWIILSPLFAQALLISIKDAMGKEKKDE